MKKYLHIHPFLMGMLLMAFCLVGHAQTPFNLNDQVATAFRVNEAPVVDGRLDEDMWRTTPSAQHFTQSRPFPQSKPTHRTEV